MGCGYNADTCSIVLFRLESTLLKAKTCTVDHTHIDGGEYNEDSVGDWHKE